MVTKYEQLQTQVFELQAEVEMLQALLLKVINQDAALHHNIESELEYIFLTQELPIEKRFDVSFYLTRLQKEYQFEKVVPDFVSFHEGLKEVLGVNELSMSVSKRLIQEHIDRGIFAVGKEILTTMK
ncbi:hypothetical protein [Exiguobacterium sp. SH3S1]|uniref:hypothetical protein n=1 Tax=Exiguobacterium sp. SH3S1 TaxID=2510955 RepID=UPI00103B846D|nr:hypothetical protein [Exiguobacterium sp. SH3S1]TCI61802.1 hypothetical protein EVJ26_09580 [Exiguobacterium sp. SH3S1]